MTVVCLQSGCLTSGSPRALAIQRRRPSRHRSACLASPPCPRLGASHMDLGLVRAGEVAERYLIVANTGDGRLEERRAAWCRGCRPFPASSP